MDRLLKYDEIINQTVDCRSCDSQINDVNILFQGIHIGITGQCKKCETKFYEDLTIGHSIYAPMYVNLTNGSLEGRKEYLGWYGKRLVQALLNPVEEKVNINFIIQNPKENDRSTDKIQIIRVSQIRIGDTFDW